MKQIVMLGTDFETMGGISAVVGVYRDSGMLARQGVLYIPTHCDGSAVRKLAMMLKAWSLFATLLLGRRVALAHIHMASRASFWRKLLFAVPAIVARVPVIVHLHGAEFSVFYERECSRTSKRAVRWLLDHADRVVVLSGYWKAWVLGITRNPQVRVIYNPVILPLPSASRKAEPGRGLFLGRMADRKGIFDLLAALARVRARGVAATLAIGGDGDVERVRSTIDRLALGDAVELLGWVRGDAKNRQFERAGFYVLPSYHEGLPMSLLEAMAAGLCVISTPVGGIPEALTDGEEGFIVEPGNVEHLARRIGQLVSSPELAQIMGCKARKRIESVFASTVTVPQVEALYAELLSRVACPA